jgi:hypothetical protein
MKPAASSIPLIIVLDLLHRIQVDVRRDRLALARHASTACATSVPQTMPRSIRFVRHAVKTNHPQRAAAAGDAGRQAGAAPFSTIQPRWLPSALIHSMPFDDPNAIRSPSGDQAGRAKPLPVASHTMSDPSALITDTTLELQ